jgi:hypothetical protein
MAELFRLGYCAKELLALNIVWRFHNLLHVLEIAKCDGHTLDKFVVSDFAEELVHHVFPRKEPTWADLRVWNKAILRLCSGSTSLPCTLGPYVCHPYLPQTWFTTATSETLFRVQKGTHGPLYDTYHLQEHLVGTQHGRQYKWGTTVDGMHPGTHFASMTTESATHAILHSYVEFPSCGRTSPSMVMESGYDMV